ncbi:MAG: aspartate/tyrosine/aromatic aminotransferase [Cellvibrionaceae bacterium]|nr:aspartate/tyrosine/aromatic aminotransferase [Cellvibrionaceae bacterium]
MFINLEQLPADPILGLIKQFGEDPREHKIDLGVGVYKDNQGLTPVMQAVQHAEQKLFADQTTKSYIGPLGVPQFNEAMKLLVLGQRHSVLNEQRIALVQTPGGCGALRVAAELIKRSHGAPTIWVSEPTWGNHTPLLGDSGLNIRSYPYYDFGKHRIQFDAMLSCLNQVPAGDFVLFHGSCHNPSGADLTREQWQQLVQLVQRRGFTPFIDLAYQGFGEGTEQDAYGFRLMAEQLPECVLAVSCSKNFGLYRERVGALAVTTETVASAQAVTTHIARVVRGIYSMPPSHGALIVAQILADPNLYKVWQEELSQMRQRLLHTRANLVEQLRQRGLGDRFDFLAREKGMFSFLGLKPEQVVALAEQFAIHMLGNSRISVCGLNGANIDYFAEALAAVSAR